MPAPQPAAAADASQDGAAAAAALPPRALSQYPQEAQVCVDFRKMSTTTLQRFCRHFRLSQVGPDAGHAELARAVAQHFESHVDVKEDDALLEFVTYVLNTFENIRFGGQEDEKRYAKRLRRKSRKPGSLSSDEDDGSTQTYCICRHVSFGEMIACDDPDCDIEWFHVECVGLKPGEVNRGTWYCPRCTERRKVAVVTRGGRGVKKRISSKE